MTIRVRVIHDLDPETLARVLMVEPPDPATRRAVRATVTAILAELGVRGAQRHYLRIRRRADLNGDLDEHLQALAECRDLITSAYPPPRRRPARPRPPGQPLIEVLTPPL